MFYRVTSINTTTSKTADDAVNLKSGKTTSSQSAKADKIHLKHNKSLNENQQMREKHLKSER